MSSFFGEHLDTTVAYYKMKAFTQARRFPSELKQTL